jgi:hypothetical protein
MKTKGTSKPIIEKGKAKEALTELDAVEKPRGFFMKIGTTG